MKDFDPYKFALILLIVCFASSIIMLSITLAVSYKRDMVNMSQVTDFAVNGDSLTLYTRDGSSYYWER